MAAGRDATIQTTMAHMATIAHMATATSSFVRRAPDLSGIDTSYRRFSGVSR
jgi:hypothetical protein